jgi:hypothetical protein
MINDTLMRAGLSLRQNYTFPRSYVKSSSIDPPAYLVSEEEEFNYYMGTRIKILTGMALVALFLLGAITLASPTLTKASSASGTGSSNSSSSPLVTLTETEYCFSGSSINGSYYCSNSNSNNWKGFNATATYTITTTVVMPNGGFCCPPTNVSSPSSTSTTFYRFLAIFGGLLSVLAGLFSLCKYSPTRLRSLRLRVDQLFHTRKKNR